MLVFLREPFYLETQCRGADREGEVRCGNTGDLEGKEGREAVQWPICHPQKVSHSQRPGVGECSPPYLMQLSDGNSLVVTMQNILRVRTPFFTTFVWNLCGALMLFSSFSQLCVSGIICATVTKYLMWATLWRKEAYFGLWFWKCRVEGPHLVMICLLVSPKVVQSVARRETGSICVVVYLPLLLNQSEFHHESTLMTLRNPNHRPKVPPLNTIAALSFHPLNTS